MKQAFHQQKRKSFNAVNILQKKCTRKEALYSSGHFIKAKKPASCISNLQI